MADAVLDSIVAAVLARLPAANETTPRYRSLAVEARLRGKSSRAFRRWCMTHNVPIRESGHKDAWVSPADVDRAIDGFTPVATRATTANEVDDAIDHRYNRRRR